MLCHHFQVDFNNKVGCVFTKVTVESYNGSVLNFCVAYLFMYSLLHLFTHVADFAFSNVTKLKYGSQELGTVCILYLMELICFKMF